MNLNSRDYEFHEIVCCMFDGFLFLAIDNLGLCEMGRMVVSLSGMAQTGAIL